MYWCTHAGGHSESVSAEFTAFGQGIFFILYPKSTSLTLRGGHVVCYRFSICFFRWRKNELWIMRFYSISIDIMIEELPLHTYTLFRTQQVAYVYIRAGRAGHRIASLSMILKTCSLGHSFWQDGPVPSKTSVASSQRVFETFPRKNYRSIPSPTWIALIDSNISRRNLSIYSSCCLDSVS